MTDTFRDRDILRRIPTPAVLHYTATAAPVPAAGGDGLDLTGHGVDAPVDVPDAADWTAEAPGTSHSCALLPPGVYLIWLVIAPHGITPVTPNLHLIDPDAAAVFNQIAGDEPTVRTATLVATAPIRLAVTAYAAADDATRVVDLDLWVTRVGAL